MKTSFMMAFLFLVLFLVGCDNDKKFSGSEYNGFYQSVTAQERMSCSEGDPWETVIPYPEYFQLRASSFFGQPIIGWHDCTGDTADSCDTGTIDLFNTFVKKDGIWQQYMTSSSGNQDICFLTYRQGIPTLTDKGLTLTVTHWEGEITLAAGEECDPDLVDVYFEEMDCIETHILEAERL